MSRTHYKLVFASPSEVKTKLVLALDPEISRVAVVAILLMAELMLIKLMEILQTGRMPTAVELAYCAVLGLMQFVTYLLTFLRKEETTPAEKQAAAA